MFRPGTGPLPGHIRKARINLGQRTKDGGGNGTFGDPGPDNVERVIELQGQFVGAHTLGV